MFAGCAGDASEEEDDEGKLFHMKLALLRFTDLDSVSHESTHKPTGKLADTCKPTSDLS
jgi:hypothetical protein